MSCMNKNSITDRCRLLNSFNKTLNFSMDEIKNILLEYRESVHNLSITTERLLIVVYSLLVTFGICANLLVCFVVARKSQMHTPRNLYVVNLSISDMSMCIICMPFTLIKILRKEWHLGTPLCKLVPVLQGTNVMISIGTITMIALDRYFTIVRRRRSASSKSRVICCIVSVWIFSMLATSPLAYYQVVQPFVFHEIKLYDTCIENWPSEDIKIAYTVGILLVQTVIPASVVSIVHARIASYLHRHSLSQTKDRRAQRELKRNKRTTLLLLGIAILFLASWLPLSMFSVLVDVYPELAQIVSTEQLYLILAACHIIAMSSAVSNPIVYGWFNSNIRNEFLQLFAAKCINCYSNEAENQNVSKNVLVTSTIRRSSPNSVHIKSEKSKSDESSVSPITS